MTVKRSMLRARTAGDTIDRKNRERSISVNCFFLTFERRGAIGHLISTRGIGGWDSGRGSSRLIRKVVLATGVHATMQSLMPNTLHKNTLSAENRRRNAAMNFSHKVWDSLP